MPGMSDTVTGQLMPMGMSMGDFVIALVTLAAVLVALMVGVMTTVQAARLRRREYKVQLLDEIRLWVKSVVSVGAPIAPGGTPSETAKAMRVNVLLSLASSYAEGPYMVSMIRDCFTNELGQEVQAVVDSLPAVMYLWSKYAGLPINKSISKAANGPSIENALTTTGMTAGALFEDKVKELVAPCEGILGRIGGLKAKLL
jgi:hypothetical protein